MVDYCPTDISNNPSCAHGKFRSTSIKVSTKVVIIHSFVFCTGPSVLFCRKTSMKKFYACSAFRSRKRCPFFLWQDDVKQHKSKIQQRQFEFSKLLK